MLSGILSLENLLNHFLVSLCQTKAFLFLLSCILAEKRLDKPNSELDLVGLVQQKT